MDGGKEAGDPRCGDLHDVEAVGSYLYERGDVGIVTIGTDGQVIRANQAALKLLGSPSEEMTRLFNLYTLPTIAADVRRQLKSAVLAGEVLDMSVDYMSMHGKKGQFRFKTIPLCRDGQPAGAVCQMFDISELRAVEERIRRTSKMESLVLMAGSLAHDLNNVFTTLVGYSSMMKYSDQGDTQRRAQVLEKICQAAESGAKLVEQLHSFTSERKVQSTTCLFDAAFRQIAEMLRYNLPPTIHLAVEAPEDAGLRVRGSIEKLEQVLLNLALNARDAVLAKGGGSLVLNAVFVKTVPSSCLLTATSNPEGYVCVLVEDTGVGINDADLARIFDPYFTTKEHGKGTGLGLSSVWGIMKEIGGCLHVESRLGEGTRFRVYFPVSKDARADRPQEVPVVVSLLGEGQRVLVVQPDAELREMLVWVLIKNGYKALAADGAAQAKRWLEDPVVSLDVAVMEGDDAGKEGWEFVSRWAQSGRPGICLVGAQSAVPEWASIAALAKPFRPEEFLRRLAEVLTAAGAGTNP